ncbi:hypothetical protein MN608_08870 [Microdochium nivale]|nr:hypothetical protein MN608_08870 [Microdochium nivale]
MDGHPSLAADASGLAAQVDAAISLGEQLVSMKAYDMALMSFQTALDAIDSSTYNYIILRTKSSILHRLAWIWQAVISTKPDPSWNAVPSSRRPLAADVTL